MKNILLIALLFSAQFCTAQSITISFDNDGAGQAETASYDFENYLIQNLITYKIDTLKALNGKITIKNQTDIITPFALARNQPRQATIFFVEPKKDFTMKMSEPTFTIKSSTGSNSQKEYTKFMGQQEVLQQEVNRLQTALTTTKFPDSLRNQINYNQMQMNAQYIEFINFEKDNNLGAYMVFDIANKNPNMRGEDLAGLYDKLSDKGKNTYLGKKVGELMNRLKAMDIGNEAPDFTLKDANGKPHKLSSLRGKYVLVDFWASWCGPCIKEIPHLKEAYEKYNKKGFEIVSVSIDREKDKWLQAVARHQMPWISILDEGAENEKVTQKLYSVPTIPRTILLDKNGIVIGRDFRGEALEAELGKLLN